MKTLNIKGVIWEVVKVVTQDKVSSGVLVKRKGGKKVHSAFYYPAKSKLSLINF